MWAICIITSDDVFDYVLDVRHVNQGIRQDRANLISEYRHYGCTKIRSLDDFHRLGADKIKALNQHKSQFDYLHAHAKNPIKEQSNGESAFFYFTQKITQNALYLLDEPENSLSPQRQLELMAFLADSVRFYGCQFIIATHSPFLMSLPMARIYDLDETPIGVKAWTELENVRTYYQFFKDREQAFGV